MRNKVPAVLQAPLERLWDQDDRVHVAGGAVRDTLMNRRVKDWDIFVPDKFSLLDISRAVGIDPQYDDTLQMGAQYFNWTDKITGTAEYKYPDGTVAQVIWLKPDTCDPFANLDRFDWGICKAMVLSGYRLYKHSDFIRDRSEKMFRLCALENAAQFAHAMARYGRLKQKYPDYGLEIPPRFAHTHTDLMPTLVGDDVFDNI